jgi:hypothetical protein
VCEPHLDLVARYHRRNQTIFFIELPGAGNLMYRFRYDAPFANVAGGTKLRALVRSSGIASHRRHSFADIGYWNVLSI